MRLRHALSAVTLFAVAAALAIAAPASHAVVVGASASPYVTGPAQQACTDLGAATRYLVNDDFEADTTAAFLVLS